MDWHGVLSTQTFWHSILESPTHPYYAQIKGVHSAVFADPGLLEMWMQGRVTSAEMLEPHRDVVFDRRAKDDFVVRRFRQDCRRFDLDHDLVGTLHEVSRYCPVIVATDNMDWAVDEISARADIQRFASGIISSSDVGVLKAQSPKKFFGPWLKANGFDFDEAVLIDDNRDNCRAFAKLGGGYVVHTDSQSTTEALHRLGLPT